MVILTCELCFLSLQITLLSVDINFIRVVFLIFLDMIDKFIDDILQGWLFLYFELYIEYRIFRGWNLV